MKFYEERFFNRRNWLLDNLYKLNLTSNEKILVLLIDFLNEYNSSISMEALSEKSNLNKNEVDEAIYDLCSKGYLKITSKNLKPVFNINPIFEAATNIVTNSNIYELFESEFGKVLSQREVNTISEWLRIYSYDQIVEALREAMINKKKSISYIDKILANGVEDE